jgi:hypothetical protein
VSDIENLRRRLAAAFVSADDDNDTPERARARKGLAAVLDYLRAAGIEADLRADLLHLYAALEDIAAGRSNSLLERATMPKGTPKKKSFETSHETMAAAAVTILKREGWKLDEATSYVARELGMSSQALADFRKEITKGKNKGSQVRDGHDWWLAHRKGTPELNAKEYVAVMMGVGRKIG